MSHAGYIDPNVLIQTEGLKVYFVRGGFLAEKQITKAVDGVSIKINKGEVMALVGESGSGKTTLGRAMIGLQKPTEGKIIYNRDSSPVVITPKTKIIKHIRRELQMVYQDPYSSIDPYMKVYDALSMPLKYSKIKDKEYINKKIEEVLNMVGLPLDLVNNYVFQLSGGQRQRLSIARALSLDPKFLVADEPVTMLDASLKGEIVDLLKKINKQTGITILFITHELPIAKIVANRISVMYKGKIVESGRAQTVLKDPLHPYTKVLLEAYPKINPESKDTIKTINVKESKIDTSKIQGCPFYDRCPFATQKCLEKMPDIKSMSSDHEVACWLY
ncbi:MAG: ABC transporter ATP-binding protein [Caldisphaera sp.]|jgi:oligopeptide/dipeptide ABC transporter ATP-binding protein|uniref:ABC transporter ATP-binding protein n=1 Tax=Caldisphaera sp. TaxID=2060322 RepID=UPI000CBA7D6A|nr:MAG: ABC transporter ATP-binding protein [Caldisphaera sp.]